MNIDQYMSLTDVSLLLVKLSVVEAKDINFIIFSELNNSFRAEYKNE
jgi:hypothetical protein